MKNPQIASLSVFSIALFLFTAVASAAPETAEFKGVIKTDIRDSTPDWAPYTPDPAPKDAPNVLFILYDDTGLAAWSAYGGGINMPTLDKLADQILAKHKELGITN